MPVPGAFEVMSKTPHALKYRKDSLSDDDDYYQLLADIVADCAPGPLRNYLAKIPTDVSSPLWTNMPYSDEVSIHVSVVGQGGSAFPGIEFVELEAWGGVRPEDVGKNAFRLDVEVLSDGDDKYVIIEFRFHHSSVR